MMFDKFTDRAKKALSFAREEARRFNHEYIGTEHILLGMIREGGGVAANVLWKMSIDLGRVRQEVERIVKQGPALVPVGALPFTPRVKDVFAFSLDEATKLGHAYIGTEHLLLGLLRENQGIAAQVFMLLDVRLDEVREEVLEFLGLEKQ